MISFSPVPTHGPYFPKYKMGLECHTLFLIDSFSMYVLSTYCVLKHCAKLKIQSDKMIHLRATLRIVMGEGI